MSAPLVCLLALSGWLGAAAPGRAQGVAPSTPRAQDGRQRGPNPGGTWEWWNDANVQREIGLTPEKVTRIDGLYRRRSNDLRPVVDQFLKDSKELEAMTKAATVDESTYNLRVIQVEALASKIRESRTMMLYRFYRELSPEQYKQLQDIFDRARSGRASRGRGPSAQ